MESFAELLEDMLDAQDGLNDFDQVMSDPRISFGQPDRPYLLANYLPERPVEDNVLDAVAVRFQSIIANAASRYSPPQYKSAVEGVEIGAKLAESNSGTKIEAPTIDTINKSFRRGGAKVGASGAATILRSFEEGVVRPLTDLAELWRAQCLVNAQIVAVGMNGRAEQINYRNPSNSRSNAANAYSDNTYDPMPDIMAKVKVLNDRGYRVAGLVMGSDVVGILKRNTKIRDRAIALRVVNNTIVNNLATTPTTLSMAALRAVFDDEELPPIQVYDATYNSTTQRGLFFWPRGTIGFFGVTGNGEDVIDQSGNLFRQIQNTLGFTGIGTPAAQTAPGRAYKIKYVTDDHPEFVKMVGLQTMLPVVEAEEAFAAIKNIT